MSTTTTTSCTRPWQRTGSADFRGLRDITDDIVLIEWDVAVDKRNLVRFAALAEGRDWPVVAPHYKVEGDTIHWVHFWKGQPVQPGDPECDQFAPGLVYLPGGLLRDCPLSDKWSPVMNEGVISRYLRSRPDWRPVPIAWDITTVHLH